MKLPIIESILHGALFPNLVLIEQEVNGKLIEVPGSISRIDYNGDIEDISMITKYETYEVDPDDPSGFPDLQTHYLLDYTALYHAFSELPCSLSSLEKLCIRVLSPHVTFDFDSERPVVNKEDTTTTPKLIYTFYFPVEVRIKDETPINPFNNFYRNVIRAEMERVKLALLDYAQKTKSPKVYTYEIVDTLMQLLTYATKASHEKPLISFYSLAPLHEINDSDLEEKSGKYNIFPLLQKYLIKTILEIEIIFCNILQKDPYLEMEKMWCDIIRCQPSFYQRLQLLAANFIYLAQFYIEENNIDELTDLLCTYSKHYSEITDNPDFKTVFKAAENAAYLRVNTDIHQLIDDQWCKAQYRVKRKDLENKILSLKNPREIQSILEDELDLLDTFITDTNINAKSIPRMMYTWITKQLKINEQHLSSTYEPVTKCTPKTQNDESELPPPDEFATNILEEQYKTFTIEVQKYGFGELEKIKCLTKGQLSKLIYLIIKNDSNYAVPMLVFLEYDKHLKTTYGMTQESIFTHWAKALGKSARAIKGNYNVLKPNSKEDQYRYNSGDFVSKVQEDYDNL